MVYVHLCMARVRAAYEAHGPPICCCACTVLPSRVPVDVAPDQYTIREVHDTQRCCLQNKPLLQRVMFLMVPGIDLALFETSRHLLPNMHSLLGEPVTVFAKSPQCFPGTLHPYCMTYWLLQRRELGWRVMHKLPRMH